MMQPPGQHAAQAQARVKPVARLDLESLNAEFDQRVIDEVALLDVGGHQGRGAAVVKLAGEAGAGGVEEALGGFGEEGAGGAGLGQVVGDVLGALVRGEGGTVGAEADALGGDGDAPPVGRFRSRKRGWHVMPPTPTRLTR
jgi:hypothetical protein